MSSSIQANNGSWHESATENDSKYYKRAKRLAWVLDRSVPLPGKMRVGIDGFIGLIPGVGDIFGSTLSAYVIYLAYRSGAPKSLLARMMVNAGIDGLIGSIPLLGDVFDFFFKANARNVDLLSNYQAHPQKTTKESRIIFGAFLIGFTVVVAVAIYISWLLLSAVWQAAVG